MIAVVFRYCCICRVSLTLRKWDFDIGFVQLRMLFYHISGSSRTEATKSHRFFSFPPLSFPPSSLLLCFCDSILAKFASRYGRSLPIVGGSQKASRWNSNRMEAVFRTFWQKRLSVVNNGSISRHEGGGRDATAMYRRWYFSAHGSLFVRRWMLIDTAASARNIETW